MEGPKTSRYYFWLIKAFLKKHYPLIIIGFTAGFLISSLLSTFKIDTPKISKKKMIGVAGSYDIATLPKFLQAKLSRGLTKLNTDQTVTGDIASEYKIEENGKKYSFTLNTNIKWPNGKDFKASEINYNFKDVKTETPNESTIIYTLKESFAPFPALTTQPIFGPSLIGLGEYKLINIKRNNNRIDFMTIQNIKSGEEEIYKFYPSEQAAITAFKLGEVNSIHELRNPEMVKKISKGTITEKINKNNFVAVFFNLKDQSLSDKSIRQALAYAITEDVKNGNKALSSYNPNSWAYNDKVKKYGYDINNAKKLLGNNKNSTSSGELKLTLTAIDIYKETAEKIQNNWKELGVETEVQIVKTIPETFQLLLASSEIPIDPDQYGMWHSTQSTNITGYQSPKIDKLLEDGRKEIEKEKRKEIYLDLQKALLEDLPAIFLYYPLTYSVER